MSKPKNPTRYFTKIEEKQNSCTCRSIIIYSFETESILNMCALLGAGAYIETFFLKL